MTRKPIVTVTIRDCIVQTFRAGGPGGQNQNKRDTGVRVTHEPSGAVGESREQRSQLQNKQTAFGRMARHPLMRLWLNTQSYGVGRAEREVQRLLSRPGDFRTEGKSDGKWTELE